MCSFKPDLEVNEKGGLDISDKIDE